MSWWSLAVIYSQRLWTIIIHLAEGTCAKIINSIRKFKRMIKLSIISEIYQNTGAGRWAEDEEKEMKSSNSNELKSKNFPPSFARHNFLTLWREKKEKMPREKLKMLNDTISFCWKINFYSGFSCRKLNFSAYFLPGKPKFFTFIPPLLSGWEPFKLMCNCRSNQ